MRKIAVRHHPLPGIGDLFELDAASGLVITIVNHRSGRRDVAVRTREADQPAVVVALTRNEAAALAALLTGAAIEVVTTPKA